MHRSLQRDLLAWYDSARRDLPWRAGNDPYSIWVSEIMLQQTQVATVMPYYRRWMERFPDVHSLANADPQEALSAWQGLGYYRRCRMLLEGARHVAERGTPKSAQEWRQVPGVGRYTAGAIASIAQGEPTPVVDGNVLRVFARLCADESTGTALEKAAWRWTEQVMSKERPGDWNQALMELGATLCRPRQPQCAQCPLQGHCRAFAAGAQTRFPVKKTASPTVALQEVAWIPFFRDRFGVRQIPAGQWWESMWEFPRSPTGEASELPRIAEEGTTQFVGHVDYQVTRHKVRMDVYLHVPNKMSAALTWVGPEELRSLPMPAPQRRALKLAQAQGNLER